MPEKDLYTPLTVGELARRSGVSISTLHFYESKNLITSERTSGNQRRYERFTLRRVAIIRTAQRCGISLKDIGESLKNVPSDRKPTNEQWKEISENWKQQLQHQIAVLTAMRDKLNSCIGCGCLSLTECPLRNRDDRLGMEGSGAILLERQIDDAQR